jgi:type I restriction enzyme S subunit
MSFKVTEIGDIPVEWKVDSMENALDEIIDYRGKTPAKSQTGIVTLSAKSVKDGYIDYSKAYFISELTYKKFMVRGFPQKGDILLTTEAPLGLVAKLDRDKVGLAQRLLTLRGKEVKSNLVCKFLGDYFVMGHPA